METNRSIRASILPAIWSTSLDLADAYFHCPIYAAFRKYLRFVWDSKVFSVSSSPIRISHSSFGLHQFFSSGLSSSANTVYPDSFLPGRFSCQGTQPRHSFVSYPDSYRPPPRTRFPIFLEEFGGHSASGFRFPKRTFQDGLGSCVSSRGEMFGSSSVYSNLSGQDISHCSSIVTTARSSQLSSRCSTVRTFTHSSPTVLSSRALDPVFSGLGSLYSYPGSSLSLSFLVDAEGKCHGRVSSGICSSQSDPIHRHFPSGMGSLSGGSNCFRRCGLPPFRKITSVF